MLNSIPSIACLRAREAASARVDGELNELDAVRLESHLAGCPACAAHALELERTTALLRGAELERPSQPVFSAAGRRARRLVAIPAAAALLIASSFALGSLVGSHNAAPVRTARHSAPRIAAAGRVPEGPDILAMIHGWSTPHTGTTSRTIAL